jgi:hypothetical protein
MDGREKLCREEVLELLKAVLILFAGGLVVRLAVNDPCLFVSRRLLGLGLLCRWFGLLLGLPPEVELGVIPEPAMGVDIPGMRGGYCDLEAGCWPCWPGLE